MNPLDNLAKATTPEECERFGSNVPELAKEARRRAIRLRAELKAPKSEVEREAYEVLYAYEEALAARHGRKVRASRTWQMIKKYQIIGAVERVVAREDDTVGYKELLALGLQELTFEAVVRRHPEQFSPEAVARSTARLERYQSK
jgi:hypothetical protein